MTQEEKARAYDEAIERAKALYDNESSSADTLIACEAIFPELAESDDERIRKELLEHCKNQAKPYIKTGNKCPQIQSWIDWLEKQGEKSQGKSALEAINEVKVDNSNSVKPADKVEPKFKVGDWITNGQLTCKVLSVTGKSYELHLYNDDYCHFETDVQSIDKDYHLWTIQDAKDGDVLCVKYGNDEMPFIFNGKKDNVAYCALNSFGEFVLSIAEWLLKTSVLPTTKEQRDLLFQKMREAGYEWDANKKALYDKPTAWSEGDERIYYSLLADIRARQDGSTNTLEAYYNEQVNWLKSIKKRLVVEK